MYIGISMMLLYYIYTVERGGYDKVAIDLAAECVTAAAEFYADAPQNIR